jgi:hypothetical protein
MVFEATRPRHQHGLRLETAALRRAVGHHRHEAVADMPKAEAAILWLREHEPGKADLIVYRALQHLTHS